jgi:hypothetical protein
VSGILQTSLHGVVKLAGGIAQLTPRGPRASVVRGEGSCRFAQLLAECELAVDLEARGPLPTMAQVAVLLARVPRETGERGVVATRAGHGRATPGRQRSLDVQKSILLVATLTRIHGTGAAMGLLPVAREALRGTQRIPLVLDLALHATRSDTQFSGTARIAR